MILLYTNCMHSFQMPFYAFDTSSLSVLEQLSRVCSSRTYKPVGGRGVRYFQDIKFMSNQQNQSAELKICGIQFQPSPVWKAPLIGKKLRVAHSKPLFLCCKEYRILISILFIKRIGKPESLCFSILFQECGF